MMPRILLSAAALLLTAPSGRAATGNIVIGALPDARCPENSAVYSADPSGPAGTCRFAFVPHWERDEPEAEAVILVHGKLVELHRVDQRHNASGPRVRYDLANSDGTIRVRLDANSHCPSGVEGCDYDGVLSVTTGSGKATIKISYYRGA